MYINHLSSSVCSFAVQEILQCKLYWCLYTFVLTILYSYYSRFSIYLFGHSNMYLIFLEIISYHMWWTQLHFLDCRRVMHRSILAQYIGSFVDVLLWSSTVMGFEHCQAVKAWPIFDTSKDMFTGMNDTLVGKIGVQTFISHGDYYSITLQIMAYRTVWWILNGPSHYTE